MANTINFKRGDPVTHFFYMPQTSWSSGGHLRFMAKPVVDDDNTDAAAVITAEWTDSATSVITAGSLLSDGKTVATQNMIQYACAFTGAETTNIPSGGAPSLKYIGEFQWTDASGNTSTFPGGLPNLECIVNFDIVREA